MKTESSLGIKGKLIALVGTAIATFAGMAIYSNYTTTKLSGTINYLGNQRIPLTAALGDIRAASNGVPRFMWLAMAFPPGSEGRKKSLEKVSVNSKLLSDSVESLGKYQLVEKAREYLQQVTTLLPNLNEGVQAGVKALELGTKEGDASAKATLMTHMVPFAVKLTENMMALGQVIDEKNRAVVAEAEAGAAASMRLLLWISSVLGIGFGIFGYRFAAGLAQSLNSVSRMIDESSSQVASASSQVSDTSQQLANSSTEQASAVEETSASLEEMTGMVENTVRYAESGLQTVENVKTVSERGNESMRQLAQAMADVMESNKRIEKLVKVIDEIGDKTQIIDEIVFQTKLLSFNASVEAERAGEHGRGFAVVAQEVGNLAQMSGKAALEISGIVKSGTKEAQEIASENKRRVEKGNEHVQETAAILKEIQKNAESVLTGSRQIQSASKEQAAGIKQISLAMENINKATQESSATSEESASAGEELNAQAKHLADLVSEMNTIISGKNKIIYTDEPAIQMANINV